MKRILSLLFALFPAFCSLNAFSQSFTPPEVLVIIAHPDDETACAATIYKITHEMKGHVDLAVITNGEDGYRYSTLAEDFYKLELTDEKIGRANLPRIRKLELNNAGGILGIRNYFFFDQKDEKYTTDEKETLESTWNVSTVKNKLSKILSKGGYDYVFCLLPTPQTHGHHKAATIIALESVNDMSTDGRPIVLGVSSANTKDTTQLKFDQYKKVRLTTINKNAPLFTLDRTIKFGYKDSLNYHIVVNWVIAEHKSQGNLQMEMNRDNYENFWYFAMNDKKAVEKTKQLFEELKKVPYPVKSY